MVVKCFNKSSKRILFRSSFKSINTLPGVRAISHLLSAYRSSWTTGCLEIFRKTVCLTSFFIDRKNIDFLETDGFLNYLQNNFTFLIFDLHIFWIKIMTRAAFTWTFFVILSMKILLNESVVSIWLNGAILLKIEWKLRRLGTQQMNHQIHLKF